MTHSRRCGRRVLRRNLKVNCVMGTRKSETRKRRLIAEACEGTPETLKHYIGKFLDPAESIEDCGLLYNALLFENVDVAKYLLSEASKVIVNCASCEDCLPLAVELGDSCIVERLLIKGAPVSVRNGPKGSTPLYDAVRRNSDDITKLLLNYGANVNAADCNGGTPLHVAAETGNKVIVDLLLNHGASVYSTTAAGTTPLHVAVKRNHIEIIKLLVSKGAWINAKTMHKRTPLHFAAEFGCTETVEFLLSNGAEVNCKTTSAWLPLHFAVEKSRKEVVELLLKNGSCIEAETDLGRTPLHIATEEADSEIVELLLKNGACVSAETTSEETPLILAVEKGRKEIMKLLIAYGATCFSARLGNELLRAAEIGKKDIVELILTTGVSVNDAPICGKTPLWTAASAGSKEVVEFLLDSGACVNANVGRDTALSAAAKKGHKEIVELLLNRGACVNAGFKSAGSVPLHLAVEAECRDTVELLLSHGADVNKGSRDYPFPLYQACEGNSRAIVDLLLGLGASINAASVENGTPLHAAAIRGDEELVALLVSRGAIVNAKSKTCATPLHLAAARGSENIVKILLSKGASVDVESGSYGTPLHAAALGHQYLINMYIRRGIMSPKYPVVRKCNRGVADLLLRHGASVKIKSVGIGYPLHAAAWVGQHDVVDLLLNNGADVDAVNADYGHDPTGRYRGTALCVAVRQRQLQVVRILLNHNPDVNSDGNKEALSIAVRDEEQQCDDIVNCLLSYGFTLKRGDESDLWVLRFALGNRCIKLVEEIVTTCVCKETLRTMFSLCPDAVACGGLELLGTLTRLGVDVNKGYNNGMTALHYLARMKKMKALHDFARLKMETSSPDTILQTIEWLLARGADVNARAKGGITPLLFAAKYGYTDMIKILAEKGAEVNAVQDEGYSALHQVLLSSFKIPETDVIDTAKLLLSLGADVNMKSESGVLPLHHASYCEPVLCHFLQNGADVNAVDNKGHSALHFVALNSTLLLRDSIIYKNTIRSTKVLLSRGANSNMRAQDGATPLHLACKAGNVELVALLIEHAVRLPSNCGRRNLASAERLSLTVNATTKDGKTPLHYAADFPDYLEEIYGDCDVDPEFPHYSGDIYEVNNMLLRSGAIINAVANEELMTPLHMAVKSPEGKLVALFLKYGADVNAKNAHGDTPLHFACRYDKATFVELMLDYGADLNATNDEGATALQCAKRGKSHIAPDHSHIKSTQAFLCLFKHIVKMKAAGLYVNEKDLCYLKPEVSEQYHAWYYTSEPEFPIFEALCQNEVSLLKNERVGDSAWVCHDILTANMSRLIYMSRDENVLLTTSSDVFKRKFPLYSKVIVGNLTRGKVRGDLLQRSNAILRCMYSHRYLPDICTDNINSYLSNADLRMFVNAYCPSD